jgi:hypothetical protein
MADNPSNIVPDNIIVVEGDAGFVPKAEPSDAGKVLKVDSQGTPVWGEDSGGTSFEPDKGLELTDGKLSVKTYYGLTNNMNGEGLVGIVPGDSTLSVNNSGIRVTNPLPASTTSDSGKVLKVDAQGAPVWGDAPAGIVEFDWSTVTLADIERAITAGKTPVMLYVPWDNAYTTKCYLQKIEHTGSGDNYVFVSTPEGFVNTPSDQSTSITVLFMMYDGSKGSNVRLVSAILSSSDGSVTMAQGATSSYLDLSVTNPLPASTSADADKVLTVNSSGNPVWATAQGGGGGGNWGMQTKYISLVDPNSSTQWRQDIPINITGSNDATFGDPYGAYPLSQLFSYPDASTGELCNGFGLGCTYILSGILPLVPPVGTLYDSLGSGFLTITDQVPDPEGWGDYTRILHRASVSFQNRYIGSNNSNEITVTEFQVVIPPLSGWADNVNIYGMCMELYKPSASSPRNWTLVSRADVSDDLLNWFRVYCTCIPTQSYVDCESV